MTSPVHDSNSSWSSGTILLYGTFGKNSPAGRAFHRRSLCALALLVAAYMSAIWVPREYHSWYWPVTGIAFTYICREWWRYIESLDELERRLQMEAAAWTYIVGIAFAMVLGGLQTLPGWKITPFWLILLEPLRAWRLNRLVRRFR